MSVLRDSAKGAAPVRGSNPIGVFLVDNRALVASEGRLMKVASNTVNEWLGLSQHCLELRVFGTHRGLLYQTDDPVPVEFASLLSSTFLAFNGWDAGGSRSDLGPAFEFNWGALPRVQVHAILPLGESVPSNSAVLAVTRRARERALLD